MRGAPVEAAREATAADVVVVARLWQQAAAELAGERGGVLATLTGGLPEPLEDGVQARIAASGHLVTVGTLDDAVVGVLLAHVQTLPDERVLAVVDLIYVERAARTVGVGEVLLVRALEWAAAQGCTGVDAPALPGMRDAKNFFERAGFVARLLVMHRPIDP